MRPGQQELRRQLRGLHRARRPDRHQRAADLPGQQPEHAAHRRRPDRAGLAPATPQRRERADPAQQSPVRLRALPSRHLGLRALPGRQRPTHLSHPGQRRRARRTSSARVPRRARGSPTPRSSISARPGGFSVDAKFNADGVCTVRNRQPRLAKNGGRTQSDIRYNAMTLAQGMSFSSILGAQFLDGRIDGYRLKDDGRLPHRPDAPHQGQLPYQPVPRASCTAPPTCGRTRAPACSTWGRVTSTGCRPTGSTATGLPKDRTPFSQTTVLTDTFPNDVTIVDLPGPCR